MARGEQKTRKILMAKGAFAGTAKWEGTRGSYLTQVPALDESRFDEADVISIREPFAYARIVYDRDKAEYLYQVWEPGLD